MKPFLYLLPLSFLFLDMSAAIAREIKYKEIPFELNEGDRLALAGVRGSVRLISTAKPNAKGGVAKTSNAMLRARKTIPDSAGKGDAFDQWTYAIRREGNVVHIEAKGPDAKSDWIGQLKSGYPEIHFEVEAPPVAAEISLRQGQIQVQNWKGNLTLQVVDGQVKLAKNEGSLRAQVEKGSVQIDGHKGRVEVDGFNPKVQVTGVEGDVNLANFAGESAVNTLKGTLQLKSFSGQTAATAINGGVDFELGRGALTIASLEGSLRGQLDNGSVSAKLQGEPDVNIESDKGGISLAVEPGASASVRLQTEEGVFNAPDSLAASKASNTKILTGRLGSGGKGSIIVRTNSGNIRIRN